MKTSSKLVVFLCICCWTVNRGLAFRETDQPLSNFDKRRAAQPPALDAQRITAADQLKVRIPTVRVDFDDVIAAPNWILNTEGFLSGPDFPDAPPLPPIPGQNPFPLLVVQAAQADPHRAIKRFLDENVNLFGHDAQILQAARITREFVDATTGMRTVVWEQQLEGISIFEAVLIGHIAKDGELVCLSSQFVPRLEDAVKLDVVTRFRLENAPPVSAQDAIVLAADTIGEQLEPERVVAADPFPQGPERKQAFTAEPVLNDALVELVWLPMDRNNLRLCWRVTLTSRSRGEMFQVVIDAQTGEVFIRHCLTAYISDASWRIFTSDSPTPFSPGWLTPTNGQPAETNRFLVVTNAVSTNASPLGWIGDGTNRTLGNNVDAHVDWTNADPRYAAALPASYPPRPTGSPFRVFDFGLDLSESDPTNSSDAVVVQLFYWCNWMHDKLYDLGFTEAAGNFQFTNTFSGTNRGGVSGDAILADAQDSATLTPTDDNRNNANFSPIVNPDGTASRIQMYIWNGPSLDRDGDLDAEVILHEYTHGLSTRRVGGGVGLTGLQPAGLGEGWSDFYALTLLSQPSDDVNGNYAFGAYVAYNFEYKTNPPTYFATNYYFGIRRYPYSTDMSKNPLTFKDTDTYQASPHAGVPRNVIVPSPPNPLDPHAPGEVWCAALWEARAKIINKLGWTNGNQLIMKLVTDGMNLTPPKPTYLQARDGILLADRLTNNGANQTELWQSFAKRGMGYGASSGSSSSFAAVVEAYDTPAQPTNVWAWTFQTSGSITSSPAIGGDGTLYVGSSDGKLYAINPNGTQKWTFNSGAAFSSSPAIGGDETIYVGCANSNLYAIKPDGNGKWTNNLGGSIFSSPAIDTDGTIYVGTLSSKFYALDTNGSVKSGWPFSASGAVYSSPAIASNGTVYFGCMDSKLYAITNGSLKWSTNLGAAIFSSPAVGRDGTIYVGSDNGKLFAVNPNGTKKWETIDTGDLIRSSPVVTDLGLVYAGSQNGKLYAFGTNSGTTNWVFTCGSGIQSSPAIGWDETVFVGSGGGTLYAIGATGSLVWTQYAGGAIISSPVIGENGMLYFGSVNSNLYALHVPTILARTSWPAFRHDMRHKGTESTLLLRSVASAPTIHYYEVYGNPGFVCDIQSSTDLANWATLGSVTLGPSGSAYSTGCSCSQTNHFFRAKSGSVLSFNAIGHWNVYAPTGYSMIANQLNSPVGNDVANVIPSPPSGSYVLKWNETAQAYITNRFSYGSWTDPNMTLNPGEGVFFWNPTNVALTLTFVGEVPQGYLVNAFPANYSIRSSMVPQSGGVQSVLKFSPENFDNILRYYNPSNSFDVYTYSFGTWYLGTNVVEPLPAVGESFFINTGTARNWSRNFSVWP